MSDTVPEPELVFEHHGVPIYQEREGQSAMKHVKIELDVILPTGLSDVEIDKKLAQVILDLGGTVLNSEKLRSVDKKGEFLIKLDVELPNNFAGVDVDIELTNAIFDMGGELEKFEIV